MQVKLVPAAGRGRCPLGKVECSATFPQETKLETGTLGPQDHNGERADFHGI